MEDRKLLIKSGTVLSLDPQVGNLVGCDVLIEGSKIAAVSQDLIAPGAEVIDATGMIVMPGFIDSHRHMWKGVLRNTGSQFFAKDRSAAKAASQLAASFRPEDVFASTLSSAAGAIDAGITTVLNHADVGGSKEHMAADLQALVDSGIRSVFAFNTKSLKAGEQPSDQLDSNQDLISFAVASADLDTASLDQIKSDWGMARQLGIRISAQVGMAAKDKEPLAALQKAKLLGPDVLYAHGNTLSDKELRLIKDSGGAVAISANTEMLAGYGAPTIQRFLDAKLQPSLGVDSEIANRGDLFSQMRAVIAMQHAMSFEKKLAMRLSPGHITTRDVVEYATINGARALGLEAQIGTLTPGKQADIILLQEHHINVMPVNDPIGAVAWAMDASNVDTVLVGGKILKRGGVLLNFELGRLQELAFKTQKHVLKAS
ncbi:MAG: amidohydrolase family protein [Anaerolineales bacterium]|nr:amidohydrolase family protein [Anaerolineales bacterium]MCW5854860.1 amidohydrolase family protein [Anaerolineales bacterium]